jgi:hypothetical protein
MFSRTVLAASLALIAWQPCAAQYGRRFLTGLVADKRGNSLPQAVVQLENTKDLTVRTFITGPNGRYYFNNLDDNTDYVVSVKYHKWRSGGKTISRFNSSERPEVNLTIPID